MAFFFASGRRHGAATACRVPSLHGDLSIQIECLGEICIEIASDWLTVNGLERRS